MFAELTTHVYTIEEGVKGQKMVKLQSGKLTKAIFYSYCIFSFALYTVTRTLAAKSESDEESSPVNNGTATIAVQQASTVTVGRENDTMKNATKNATTTTQPSITTTKKRMACACFIYHISYDFFRFYWEKELECDSDSLDMYKTDRTLKCDRYYKGKFGCEDKYYDKPWRLCHSCEKPSHNYDKRHHSRKRHHRMKRRIHGYFCICCIKQKPETTISTKRTTAKKKTIRFIKTPVTTVTSTTEKTTKETPTERLNREKLPGIISGGLGILSVLLTSMYLCITRFPFQECVQSDEKEEEEVSESSSDEGYDFGEFNEEELARKAAFEWCIEKEIRCQEVADTLAFIVIPTKRLKFKYKSNENEDSPQEHVTSSIEVHNSPKRKRKSRWPKDPGDEPEFFNVDDISKDKATTTVKVLVNKPVLDQAAKPEDCDPISKEPAGILAANTGKACTTASPMYDVPKCSKSKKRDIDLPQPSHLTNSSAAIVRHTYMFNDTGTEQRDHRTRKLPEPPTIRIDMAVNETKKTEEQRNQIRLTTRRDDSGIYEEIDDVIKKIDCEK